MRAVAFVLVAWLVLAAIGAPFLGRVLRRARVAQCGPDETVAPEAHDERVA